MTYVARSSPRLREPRGSGARPWRGFGGSTPNGPRSEPSEAPSGASRTTHERSDRGGSPAKRLKAPSRTRPTTATSALAVLRSLTGLLEAVLLPLRGARVTGQEAGLLEGRAVLGVDLDQGAGDREAQSAGLARRCRRRGGWRRCRTSPACRRSPGAPDELLVHLVREVLREGAAVELELTGTGDDADADHGFLATADGLGVATRGARRTRGGRRLALATAPSIRGGPRERGSRPRGVSGWTTASSPQEPRSRCWSRLFLTHCATCAILVIWRVRLLSGVRVLRAGVHLQLLGHGAAELVLRQHALHGLFDRLLGLVSSSSPKERLRRPPG